MSVDREYNVKIKLVADNAGAADATGALGDVGKASTKAGEEGTKAAEGMFDKHTELRHLLHGLGDAEVPGLGRAFSMLALGPLGAVVALTAVVEFLKQGIADTNRKLDEMAATASKAFGGSDWITDYVNAMSQAATETEALAEALKKASDAGPEINRRYDAETKAIQASVDALKAKLKAEEDLALAEARKNGATPEEQDAMRARYEAQGQAAQDAADAALQAARQRELAERQRNQAALDADAAAKKTPAGTIQTRAERDASLKAQEAALNQATSDMHTAANDALKDQIEGNKALLEDSRKRYGNSDPLGLVKKMQDETDKLESETAEARAAAAKARIADLGKQVISDQENSAKEKDALSDATKAATDNSTRVVELQKQIADANRTAQIKTESASKLINDLTAGQGPKDFERTAGVDTSAGMADFVNKFIEAQQRLQSHQGKPEDQQMVVLMNRLLSSTRESDKATYVLLETFINQMDEYKKKSKQDFQDLMSRVERARY